MKRTISLIFAITVLSFCGIFSLRSDDKASPSDPNLLLTKEAQSMLTDNPDLKFKPFLQNGRPYVFRKTSHYKRDKPINEDEQLKLKKETLMNEARDRLILMIQKNDPTAKLAGIQLTESSQPRLGKTTDGKYSFLCDSRGFILLMP